MFSSLRYSVKQAFVQVFRNRAMSLASMFSITAMLLILGLFFVIMVNIGVGIEKAKTEFDSYPHTSKIRLHMRKRKR